MIMHRPKIFTNQVFWASLGGGFAGNNVLLLSFFGFGLAQDC